MQIEKKFDTYLEATNVYNERYSSGYRSTLPNYEYARQQALEHFVSEVAKCANAKYVLDYGSGSGLFIPLWEKIFGQAALHFCDISPVALEMLAEKHPNYANSCYLVYDDSATAPADTFDVIVSVEVMEHVTNLDGYVSDIFRLLRPGGSFIWTTPCGNRFSIEHLYSCITRKIESTDEGYRRWVWEDPTHLRRMRTTEVLKYLDRVGFTNTKFRLRSHLFSFLVLYVFPRVRPLRLRKYLESIDKKILQLDYKLFRCLPNGASMIGVAKKPTS